MQLAGPGVFGPPKDRHAALAVLREVVAQNINHIDSSDYYGPHVTNELAGNDSEGAKEKLERLKNDTQIQVR